MLKRLLYQTLSKHGKLQVIAFRGVLPPLMFYRLILKFKSLVLLGRALCDDRRIGLIYLHSYSNIDSRSFCNFVQTLYRTCITKFTFSPLEQFHQTVKFLVGRLLALIRTRKEPRVRNICLEIINPSSTLESTKPAFKGLLTSAKRLPYPTRFTIADLFAPFANTFQEFFSEVRVSLY